jgi:competence CoiA-like predicted nuclease
MKKVVLNTDHNVVPVSDVDAELIYAGIVDKAIITIIYNSHLSVYQTNWLHAYKMQYNYYENVALEKVIEEMLKDDIQVYEFALEVEFGAWIVESKDLLY